MLHHRGKGADETVTYRVDFSRALESTWLAGFAYSLAQYVRPTNPNGFEYECTGDGQSATDEPDWPTTIGETVTDGSLEWTCRDFGTSATDTISTRTVTADSGITVQSSSIDGTRVNVTLTGGTVGKVYDVSVEINSAAGEKYDELLRITVTE